MVQDFSVVATTLALYLAVAVTPGPSFALISRLAISGARSAAFGATLGMAIGATFYALITMAGLGVMLAHVGWLSRLIQIAGGCYLVYLGLSAWRTSSKTATEEPLSPRSGIYGLRTGILVCLGNPKAIAFFVGLYAVAIPQGTASWAKWAIIIGGFTIEICWYGLVALLCSTRGARALYERWRLVIERTIGTVLGVLGVRLIWQRI